MGANTVATHTGTDFNDSYITIGIQFKFRMGSTILNLKGCQCLRNKFLHPVHFDFRKLRWLHMSGLNKMRISCSIFLCHRQHMMSALIRNTFTAIFIAFDIFFNNCLLFKGITHCLFHCRSNLLKALHPHNTAASGTVGRFYNHWKLHRFYCFRIIIPFTYTDKARCRHTMLRKSFPHSKFIGRYIDTVVRIMW